MSMQSVTASSHPTLSYTDSLAASTSDTLLLIARILMGWIFVRSGLGKLMDINAFIASMPGRGLPGWLGYVAAPVEFFGSSRDSSLLANNRRNDCRVPLKHRKRALTKPRPPSRGFCCLVPQKERPAEVGKQVRIASKRSADRPQINRGQNKSDE